MTITHLKLPNSEEQRLATLATQKLSAIVGDMVDPATIIIFDKHGDSREVSVSLRALNLMLEILTQFSQGNTASVTPIRAKLTTREAANLLNISHAALIKLLDSKQISFVLDGKRKTIALYEVLEYRHRLKQKRLGSLAKLSKSDQQLDMGYD